MKLGIGLTDFSWPVSVDALISGVDFGLGVEPVAEHLRDLAAVGIDHAIITPGGPWSESSLADATALLHVLR